MYPKTFRWILVILTLIVVTLAYIYVWQYRTPPVVETNDIITLIGCYFIYRFAAHEYQGHFPVEAFCLFVLLWTHCDIFHTSNIETYLLMLLSGVTTILLILIATLYMPSRYKKEK